MRYEKLVVRSGENLQKRIVGPSGVRAHKRCVCALADVVATKLGIILSFFSFFALTFLPEGVWLKFGIFEQNK